MAIQPPVEAIDGRYEIGPVIGSGAMGEVRRARDLRLGRDVAIKFLRTDLAADPTVRARFEFEARAAANLAHPAIVTVFDSGEWGGIPYLVMECLHGRTLADEMEVSALPAARVREIAVDLAAALDMAHRQGVMHRDVKPGNILLTETGRVKLADFGIAKSTESVDHTVAGMIIGTPAYLAPERLAGQPATAQSDLYALGVVLYEGLAGERPFRGDTPIAVAHAVHTNTPAPLGDSVRRTDPVLASIIGRLLAKNPADRPPSAGEIVGVLASGTSGTSPTLTIATGQPSTATQVLTETPAPPSDGAISSRSPGWWGERKPAQRWAIGAAGIIALLALMLLLPPTGAGERSDAPPTTSPATVPSPPALPGPLDDALQLLEESVRP